MSKNKTDFCEFCDKLKQCTRNDSELLYEDSDFFAFYDIDRATAREHILVCPKEHIETATDITQKDALVRMQEIGTDVLDQLCESKGLQNNYRFGFHLRPFNSINHVHLHGFVLPFSSLVKDKIVYGHMLTPV